MSDSRIRRLLTAIKSIFIKLSRRKLPAAPPQDAISNLVILAQAAVISPNEITERLLDEWTMALRLQVRDLQRSERTCAATNHKRPNKPPLADGFYQARFHAYTEGATLDAEPRWAVVEVMDKKALWPGIPGDVSVFDPRVEWGDGVAPQPVTDDRRLNHEQAERFKDMMIQEGILLPRPARDHHLRWVETEWADARCGCRYHPDDDNGTHGGAPHVHLCERHQASAANTSA